MNICQKVVKEEVESGEDESASDSAEEEGDDFAVGDGEEPEKAEGEDSGIQNLGNNC